MPKRCYRRPWSGFNCNIAKGIKDGEFYNLPEKTIIKLLKIISRISEMSYRRGAQQGATFANNCFTKKDYIKSIKAQTMLNRILRGDFRFDYSLDDSPFHCAINIEANCGGEFAKERMEMEYFSELLRVGLFAKYERYGNMEEDE